MRQFRTLVLVLAAVALATVAVAGPGVEQPQRPRTSADVVKASVRPAELTAAAGGEVVFTVHLEIADTWHLYGHQYAEDPESFYIGVDLMPGEGANLAGWQATFPVGEKGDFDGEMVVMLHHEAAIEVTAKLPADATGTVELPLVLTVQACDSKVCLQPDDVPVLVKVAVQ